METILSFLLVLIFSGWVMHLKTEISALEKMAGHMIPAPLHSGAHGSATTVLAAPAHSTPAKPTPAPQAPQATGAKSDRNGGVQVWTIN